MSLNRIFDIAGSGMAAQSLRLNTTASNLANANSAASSDGEVYRAKKPIFAAVQQTQLDQMNMAISPEAQGSQGVQVRGIVESQAPLDLRYEPDHPLADEQGYVTYPNVNVVEEMTDMISASRSFQTNVEIMNTAKQLVQRVLTLGQ